MQEPIKADSPIVEEVRARRMRQSAKFGHDLRRYFDHLRQAQEQYADRLVDQITVVRSGGRADQQR